MNSIMQEVVKIGLVILLVAGIMSGLIAIQLSQPRVAYSNALALEGKSSAVRVYDNKNVEVPLKSDEAKRIIEGPHESILVP
jgi:hypothetical protein